MKMKWIVIFLSALSMIAAAVPAYAAWVPAGLQGLDVLSLAEDPGTTTTWYAGTDGGQRPCVQTC